MCLAGVCSTYSYPLHTRHAQPFAITPVRRMIGGSMESKQLDAPKNDTLSAHRGMHVLTIHVSECRQPRRHTSVFVRGKRVRGRDRGLPAIYEIDLNRLITAAVPRIYPAATLDRKSRQAGRFEIAEASTRRPYYAPARNPVCCVQVYHTSQLAKETV